MPGSPTTPGWPSARVGALGHIAFHYTDSVGTRNHFSIAAQWLACTFPYRRFADILADACARLGADVGRYSFIVVDLHHLLLAGLPAHPCEKKIAASHWAIYCRGAGEPHCEDFGSTMLSAIELPTFLYAGCFHTASGARRSGPDRRHQRSHTEDRYHSLRVIGQNVEAHLGSHLLEGPGQEVGGAHPSLEGFRTGARRSAGARP